MNAVDKANTMLNKNTYNKNDCKVGIVHIGIGAFHRAHQAVYVSQLLNEVDQQHWGIAGVNLRAQEAPLVDQLKAQNHSYVSKTVSSANEVEYHEINSILASYDWSSDADAAAAIVAEKSVHVVTMTVTESGYYLSDDGVLDVSAEPVAEGLKGQGSCIYTYLRAALNLRMKNNGDPITLLCCDNLRHNGDHLKTGLTQFLEACGDHELMAWIESNATFPCCMVDRITPRIEKMHSEDVKERFGLNDELTVLSEDFTQWIIEEKFAGPFPPLNLVGAQLVEDVEPYEEAKIRILNGGHTIVAYFAALKGYRTYDAGILDEELSEFFTLFQNDEVIPALGDSPIKLDEYSQTVKSRFSNQNISDSIARICMDGVSKFSIFILVTLINTYKRGDVPHQTIKGIATWYVFMKHVDKGLIDFEYVEPKWDLVQDYIKAGGEKAFVESELIWGSLPKDFPVFGEHLLEAIAIMTERFPY